MELGHQQHPYRPTYDVYNDPISSPAAFIAALALMLLMFVIVVLLWAP